MQANSREAAGTIANCVSARPGGIYCQLFDERVFNRSPWLSGALLVRDDLWLLLNSRHRKPASVDLKP